MKDVNDLIGHERIVRGLIASATIQCVHPVTGRVGSWLFTGGDHHHPTAAVSPTFDDFAGLAIWCANNGWRDHPGYRFIFEGYENKSQIP